MKPTEPPQIKQTIGNNLPGEDRASLQDTHEERLGSNVQGLCFFLPNFLDMDPEY